MQKILFIGASGMLGKPVAKELIQAGYELTLLARDKAKMQQLFPGIKVVQGDVFDIDSLKKALAGQEIVYLNLSVDQSSKKNHPQPEREGIANVIASAKEMGVKRLGYLSSLVKSYEGMNGFNWWSFQLKHKAVDAIRSSGIPYSIFYPSTFMETFPFQMMRGNKIAMLGHSLMPMWFIAGADYGKQVANAFARPGNENTEYAIQGTESFTFAQAVKVAIENYTKAKLKPLKVPVAVMKFLGTFSPKFNYAWHICEALNKYPEKFESENTWRDLGKPATSLADYVKAL